ncbi:MAG: DUF3795 domain-containing protein [Anaerolineae bacterium]
METRLSVCGADCTSCEYLNDNQCPGCADIEGKVWWATYVDAEICPIYDCAVHEKQFDNCGQCDYLPCELWRALKDPDYSDEEHEASIQKRVSLLQQGAG